MTEQRVESMPAGSAASLGALVRSELRRLMSRRAVRGLFLIGLGALVASFCIAMLTTGRPTEADWAAAQWEYDQTWADLQDEYSMCLEDFAHEADAEGLTPEEWCGSPEEWLSVDMFLQVSPFSPRDVLVPLVQGMGVAAAFLAFLIGATSVGADWASRSMGLLLTWEPRRTRVFMVRLALVTVTALALGTLLMGVMTVLGSWGVNLNGSWDGFTRADATAAAEAGFRLLLMAPFAAAAGFALAMMARHTGFAFMAAAGYATIVEMIVRIGWPWAGQWLVSTNVMTVFLNEPTDVYIGSPWAQPMVTLEPDAVITVTPERAVPTILVWIVVLVALSWVSFRRRDVSS